MASFSGLGIGLSFVFGFIFLGLFAEFYYIWNKKKKKMKNRGIEENIDTNYTKSFSHLFCLYKKPTSEIDPKSPKSPNFDELTTDPELGLPKKGFGEEGLDSELIRLHNLCGPPRFLFTIKEETKEDLDSEDGRSTTGERSKKLGDFLFTIESPVLTPISSPRVYNQNGFNLNSLIGGLTEAEVNRALNSPPPKFKFLRDAEEKFVKRKLLIEETEKRRERQFNSFSSKVLPLGSSPLSIESI